MKTNQEMLAILKGPEEGKLILLDELIQKAGSSSGLEAGEIVFLEALKRDLIKPKSIVIEMSAGLKGVGGVKA